MANEQLSKDELRAFKAFVETCSMEFLEKNPYISVSRMMFISKCAIKWKVSLYKILSIHFFKEYVMAS